ncbi:hypothetical protein MYCTH_2310461 [Thermothelomyces thermophilus ATCC 42464]|uniref:Mid2 domain-containing protein n=1 Tax=Thermothelomyces thermophilus (strain ATCC 42464 / BCRC 31852 / DSM 1799) TaxID=573729 RepID=G2QLJ1_THET4|nr:uncharacterized protein MYCTH_2310461 [Thermothelomyces thermophilus ATCC 42464]AEO60821.1 hypothetical protein MYCTH_2310461 [Thermothelomyces thermophilus ATCC 42464]
MLVIRFFWLQAVLATAQLVDSDGVLGGGGDSAPSSVEEQSPVGTNSPGGILDGVVDKVGGAADKLLSPILDPIVGPTGLFGDDDDAATSTTPAETQDLPPVTSVESSAADPEPTSELATEPTSEATNETTTQPTTREPAPTSQQQPPASSERPSPLPGTEEQQQPTADPAPVPKPDISTVSEAPPSPTTSAAEAPAPSSSVAGVIRISQPVDSPAGTSSAPVGQSPTRAPAPGPTSSRAASQPAASSPPPGDREPVSTLVTTSGTTFLSVFVPPTPTGRLAVIGDTGEPLPTLDLSGQSPSSPEGDGSSDDKSPATAEDETAAGSGGSPTESGTTGGTGGKGIESSSSSSSSSSDGLPLKTKIGIGVGAGAGSIAIAVTATLILWKIRMGRRPASSSSSEDRERGASPTPQEKAKMDFESEHDVAFDFGFLRDRAAATAPPVNATGGGVATGAPGVGRKLTVVNKGEDEWLSTIDTPRQQQQQQFVAELDGGEVPGYYNRGAIGVGR